MNDARKLWVAGSTPPVEVQVADIAARDERLRRRVRLAHGAEYAAGALVIVHFTALAALPGWTRLPAGSRVGAALIALGCVFVLTFLALRGTPAAPPAGASTLVAYRAALAHRRALLGSVVRWYLAPLWPGVALFIGGIAWERRGAGGGDLVLGGVVAVVVAVNVAILWVNRRAARRLTAELETLPEPPDEPR